MNPRTPARRRPSVAASPTRVSPVAVAAALTATLTAAVGVAPATAQTSDPGVATAASAVATDAITRARETAEAAGAALLAPDAYAAALKELARARGPAGVDAAREAQAAQLFGTATTQARAAATRFATVIAAREQAQAAEAFRFAATPWLAAEQSFGDLVRRYARRDDDTITARIEPAAGAYAEAELAALRNRYLAPVRAQLAEADAARANRFAPLSLADAQARLEAADAALAANRATPDAAEPAIAAATAAAATTARLARELRRVNDGERTAEELVLDLEATLVRVAGAAGLEAQPVTGNPAAVDDLVARATALRAGYEAAVGDVAERDRLIASLEEEIRELDARLGGTAAERDRLVMRAERDARLREQAARAAALFAGNEAQVVSERSGVIIRVTGLDFGRGGELDRRGKGLLDRVAEAIALFPGAAVLVEGHTDATGSDEANQRASELRAEAVARQLELALKLAPGRIGHTGYGKGRPIAGNDTPAGRARNRRVEVVITPPA